jgi:basic membrane protein A and related proteins
VKKSLCVAVGAALLLSLGLVGSSGATSHATFLAALVSDVGKFNDKSFNQNQLAGLNEAKAKLGVSTLPLQSNSSSDYLPNLTTAVRRGANIVMAAGFLLAPTLAQVASQFPNTDFTITDDSVKGPDFKGKSVKNIEGLTYASNEAGCLVGYLAAEMVKMQGGKQVMGAVGGLNIPSVNDYIVGYKYCAQKYEPSMKVLTGYSNSFTAEDACKTVAQNQIGQGSQVEFQVAGGCGLGVLNAAAQAGKWGIGVDVDQFKLANHVLTSAIKRVDTGIFDAIEAAKAGKFKGGTDVLYNLNNNGVGVGTISPQVPAKFIAAMNKIKAEIMTGKLDVPTTRT